MAELSHKPCPHPECGSSDAFSYNTQGFGKCHSCGNPYPMAGVKYDEHWLEEYPLKHMSNQQPLKKETPSVEPVTYVTRPSRGIIATTMEFFGVTTGLDVNGNEVCQEYPYPTGTKVRYLPKTFSAKGGFKGDQLFAMDKFEKGSAKAITVVEGELDAMSVYQMMGGYPVVSLPNATPSRKIYERCKDYLDSFEKIYVSFDSDGKADGVAAKLATLFPNRVYKVTHTKYKDANEYLTEGAAADYKAAWWGAQKYTPDNVFNSTEDFLNIYRESDDNTYLSTGIQAFDDVCLGLMKGHFTVFQAPEGIGKTEFMRMLEFNILSNNPTVPIAICHMEESKKRSLLGLVSYKLQKNVTRQELIDDLGIGEEVEKAIVELTENEKLYQFTIGVDDDPLDLLEKIRYFATACDCEYIFFEPIQDLGYSRQGDETLESFLSSLATKLARLASELNVGIISIAHENDDGNIRDCRMIGKRASVVVKLQRDKMSDDPEVRDTTSLLVTKNRPASMTGPAGLLTFDPQTFTLKEKYVV